MEHMSPQSVWLGCSVFHQFHRPFNKRIIKMAGLLSIFNHIAPSGITP